MKKVYTFLFLMGCSLLTTGQSADTVEVELAKSSKVIFILKDPADLEELKEYDYDALFSDILAQLRKNNADPRPITSRDVTITPEADIDDEENEDEENEDGEAEDDEDEDDEDEDDEDEDDEDEEGDEDEWDEESDYFPCSRTYFVEFDFGMNNFLTPGQGVNSENDFYTVRPWGSWYVGYNVLHRVYFNQQVSLEGKLGLSVYNFKFDEDNVRLTKTPDGTVFSPDPRPLEFTKSKLTVSHINASLIPVFNIGRIFNEDRRHHCTEFRIGLGPYVGYRLGSYNKLQYKEVDDDKENERHRSNFHLNNLRYGVRLQLGIRDMDFFFQYDLNEMFKDDKGPRLNAYSFGISF